MKNKGPIAIISIAVLIVIIVAIVKNNKQGDTKDTDVKNPTTQNTVIDTNQGKREEKIVDPINITAEQLKGAIEKTESGIKISNVKLVSNSDYIVTITLDAKNENGEERVVEATVNYYDANNKLIGVNGFSIGVMQPNESKSLESTCYIENKDVKDIKIEVKANVIEKTNPNGADKEGK